MWKWLMITAALALGSCGNDDKWAESAVPPSLNEMTEIPGDWSSLAGAIGRTPTDSGLMTSSAISVDLNAMLGPQVDAYRAAMADATPLIRQGPVLVSQARNSQAYLVIDPADHSLEVGIRQRNGWRTSRTPGSEVQRPPGVQALLQD